MAKLDTYSTTSYVGQQIKRLAEESTVDYEAGQIATTNTVTPTARDDATRWATRTAIAGRDYGIAADGTTDDAPEINAIMAALAERGGGILELPAGNISVGSTLDNKYPRVMVVGAGNDYFSDSGTSPSPNPRYGTRILPTFAGTVLKHRTPYVPTSIKFSGGGFARMMVDGNGVATRLLEVDTINNGQYDLFLLDCVGTEAAYFKCGISNVDITGSADIQRAKIRLMIRQLGSGAPQSCKGVVFDGSSGYSGTGSFANVSFNDAELVIQHLNGDALEIISGDNNNISLVAFRGGGGTGRGVLCRGVAGTARPVGGDSNVFTKLSCAGSIYAEGTSDVGVTAAIFNVIDNLDTGNGTPEPTTGTGSRWFVRRLLNGVHSDFVHSGPAVLGSSVAGALAQRALVGSESLRVANTSSAHSVWTDGTNTWGVAIDGATGDFRFNRTAGSGVLNLGNGADTRTFGRTFIRNNRIVFENSGGTEVGGIRYGTGTPEGAVSSPVGTIFIRTDGGASTVLYVKETGTGNTGWVAK